MASSHIKHHPGRGASTPAEGVQGFPERLLDRLLDTDVDREDQVVAAAWRGGRGRAHDPPEPIDLKPLHAVGAAQCRVIGVFQPGDTDQAVVVVAVPATVGVELLLRDRAEIAEFVCGQEGVRVLADGLQFRRHAGKPVRMFDDRQRLGRGDVLGHRHRLVGRAVPARWLHRSRAVLDAPGDIGGGHTDHA